MCRQRFFPTHVSPIVLLSLVMVCVPLAWAQAPRVAQGSIAPSTDAVALEAFQPAKGPLLTSYEDMPPNFPPQLSENQSGPRPLSGSGKQLLLQTNKPVLELAGKPNFLMPAASREWLTNPPDNVDYQPKFT